jgi:membrane protease subunit (stomatin/prohibitin family)
MSLKDNLDNLKNIVKKQLRSVIEWENPHADLLFERWSENGDEIKNASKLIVSPGQGCIFVYQGKVESILTDEGMTTLATDNIPFWTTVTKVMQAFESEHKVGLYFFRQTQFLNLLWGTTAPVKYDDPKYKFPVGLGAHGNFSLQISKPALFFKQIVGSTHQYKIQQIQQVLRGRITQPLTDILATSGHSYAEIDKNREELSEALSAKAKSIFDDLGLSLLDIRIEGTNFDETTQARINKIADAMADAQAFQNLGINYTQKEQLEALKIAAGNEGGLSGMSANVMAGAQLGAMMGNQLNQQNQSTNSQPEDIAAKLQKLKGLFDQGLIDEAEFKAKKAELLKAL